jgi:hypothetical protein
VGLVLLTAMAASSASAHVVKRSGPFDVKLGWGNEPALAGADNFVEAEVSDAASGAPVAIPAGRLSVEVSYGGKAITRPLDPDEEGDGMRAELIPTQPGVYTFHITGTAAGRTLDVRATCSESTFNCVEDSGGIEFPVKEPSAPELAQRLSRESGRAETAADTADSAKALASAALAIAALAGAAVLAMALLGWRRRRQS